VLIACLVPSLCIALRPTAVYLACSSRPRLAPPVDVTFTSPCAVTTAFLTRTDIVPGVWAPTCRVGCWRSAASRFGQKEIGRVKPRALVVDKLSDALSGCHAPKHVRTLDEHTGLRQRRIMWQTPKRIRSQPRRPQPILHIAVPKLAVAAAAAGLDRPVLCQSCSVQAAATMTTSEPP
jgi:hypothetical protein